MVKGQSDIRAKLGIGSNSGKRRWPWWVGGIAVVLLLVTLFSGGNNSGAVRYKTSQVTRGELTLIVTATGTLQPVNQVEVGSELSGTLASVEVDFNDRVEVGQELARLDTATLENRISEARASLQSARAKVQEAEATELEKKAALSRCRELAKRQMCSENDVDTAAAAYARARAGVSSAKAQVAIAEAVLEGHETNLTKAIIRSPINGIVLDRKVESGQTVAASLQTPELFTLAEDLTHMELLVAVDEADIGRISDGLDASFTVDAYPDETFSARITQIRHAPQTVEGVVSYETVLTLENPEQKLLPGMTATAEIVTRRIEAALLIPNAALRYAPPVTNKGSGSGNGGGGGGGGGSLLSRMFRPPGSRQTQTPTIEGKERQVWVLREGKPQAVSITIGESDGAKTEVLKGDLEAGAELVTEQVEAKG